MADQSRLATATGRIPQCNGLIAGAEELLPVLFLHIVHAGTGGIVELLRVGIKDIICLRRLTSGHWLLLFRLWGRCGSYRSRLLLLVLRTICQLALACGIVNLNARLDILGKNAVGNPGTLVFHRIAFHQNTVSQQVIPFKDWGHAI